MENLYSKDQIKEAILPFLKFVKAYLKIMNMPKVTLVGNLVQSGNQPTFATYNIKTNQVTVRYNGRHMADIKRSLAHELVHAKQNEDDQLHDGSGETGSEHENEANAIAGSIMRDWAKKNPTLMS